MCDLVMTEYIRRRLKIMEIAASYNGEITGNVDRKDLHMIRIVFPYATSARLFSYAIEKEGYQNICCDDYSQPKVIVNIKEK